MGLRFRFMKNNRKTIIAIAIPAAAVAMMYALGVCESSLFSVSFGGGVVEDCTMSGYGSEFTSSIT